MTYIILYIKILFSLLLASFSLSMLGFSSSAGGVSLGNSQLKDSVRKRYKYWISNNLLEIRNKSKTFCE